MPLALDRPFPPTWVPRNLDFDDPSKLAPLFDELETRASTKDLRAWLQDWSELESAFYEEGSRRYVAMTCDTEDPAKEKRYLHFETVVTPFAKPRWQTLKELYLKHPKRKRLPKSAYGMMDLHLENEAKLYREENVALEARDSELRQQYQKIAGAMTATYDGREQTLAQLGKVLEETDRKRREEVWRLVAERRLRDREALEELYDKMVALRTRIGRNAGFRNYRDYVFRAKGRFDYGPRECLDFRKANEKAVVPALRRRHARRKSLLGVDRLRPWDLAVDPQGREPLRPFKTAAELMDGCSRIFKRVHPDFHRMFEYIRSKGYLDLESRKGKAPGGYQTVFDVERVPFIFANSAGLHRDVETLLHEGGHAFHSLQCREREPRFNRDYPTEFAEVASMGMELLGQPYLEEFYPKKDADRARAGHLEDLLTTYPWVATIDAFQHWVYTTPEHGRDERKAAWAELRRRLGGGEEWSGLEDALAHNWHRQLHLFTVPFYYIEYGIAQTGALQVWRNARRDRAGAIAAYRRGESLGWTRPLPGLFRAAGLRFDFGERTIRPLISAALEELEKLDA
ncbi:MAG TPA: M3 family oligoendopeptidase [Planctomycetota bacterium]|nr:M3 family oligoendopeptidase [Planctomycetota bacterium]